MSDARVDLDDLLTGQVAGEVMRALMRDLGAQQGAARCNGVSRRPLPAWAQPLLQELAARADAVADASGIGPRVASLPAMSEGMLPVAEAAELVGRSERHVRRLASAGRVRHRRVGRRSLLVDVESLRTVINKTTRSSA